LCSVQIKRREAVLYSSKNTFTIALENFPILSPTPSKNKDCMLDTDPIAILSLAPLCVAVFSGQ